VLSIEQRAIIHRRAQTLTGALHADATCVRVGDKAMADLSQKIPNDLRDAFRSAVLQYPAWTPSEPEIEIGINQQFYSTTTICGLVDNFSDPLPPDIFARLISYMDLTCADLQERLAGDRSYATGAFCYREFIKRRKAEHDEIKRRTGG
jgi:hypothetical protein